MNAFEYIMERNRMCDSFGSKCKGCPANFDDMFCGFAAMSTLNTKEQFAIVEKWSIEHPKKQKKTRQDVFLEQYPEAQLDAYGVLRICPADISAEYRDKGGDCLLLYSDCRDCRASFWMAKVKEDE